MYRSSMTGLGTLALTSPTGVLFFDERASESPPPCITAAEKAEANQKCPVQEIRGLGAGTIALANMTGRLSGYSPCALADLPVCPTPRCIDANTVDFIFSCIANPKGPNCNLVHPMVLAGLSQLPFCAGAGRLPPIPQCLSTEMVGLRDYCAATNGRGPSAEFNAGCWLAMHDPAYWAQVMATPRCYDQAYTPPPPPPPAYTPPSPVEEPPSAPDDEDGLSIEPEGTESGMAGMWGILALLAAAGGGYYMYRRYKK